MYNERNHGQVIGIIAPARKGSSEAVTFFAPNKDNSQRIAFSVLAGDNFRSRYSQAELDAMSDEAKAKRVGPDGKGYKSQRISLTKFLPYDASHGQPSGITMYKNLKPGDLVVVSFSIKSNRYTDKDGKDQFNMSLEVESLQTLRHATATATAPAAAAPAPAPAPAPVADTGVNTDGYDAFDPDADGPF